jgi:hypothetical protein
MMNPTMVTREVGRTIDRDRVHRAEAFRTTRRARSAGSSEGVGERSAVASASATRRGRVLIPRPWRRRGAATTPA